jgi:hypothetical protein
MSSKSAKPLPNIAEKCDADAITMTNLVDPGGEQTGVGLARESLSERKVGQSDV